MFRAGLVAVVLVALAGLSLGARAQEGDALYGTWHGRIGCSTAGPFPFELTIRPGPQATLIGELEISGLRGAAPRHRAAMTGTLQGADWFWLQPQAPIPGDVGRVYGNLFLMGGRIVDGELRARTRETQCSSFTASPGRSPVISQMTETARRTEQAAASAAAAAAARAAAAPSLLALDRIPERWREDVRLLSRGEEPSPLGVNFLGAMAQDFIERCNIPASANARVAPAAFVHRSMTGVLGGAGGPQRSAARFGAVSEGQQTARSYSCSDPFPARFQAAVTRLEQRSVSAGAGSDGQTPFMRTCSAEVGNSGTCACVAQYGRASMPDIERRTFSQDLMGELMRGGGITFMIGIGTICQLHPRHYAR